MYKIMLIMLLIIFQYYGAVCCMERCSSCPVRILNKCAQQWFSTPADRLTMVRRPTTFPRIQTLRPNENAWKMKKHVDVRQGSGGMSNIESRHLFTLSQLTGSVSRTLRESGLLQLRGKTWLVCGRGPLLNLIKGAFRSKSCEEYLFKFVRIIFIFDTC